MIINNLFTYSFLESTDMFLGVLCLASSNHTVFDLNPEIVFIFRASAGLIIPEIIKLRLTSFFNPS